jgi:Ulp1 family protease
MLRIKMENSNDIIFIHKASFLAKTRSLQAAKEIVALSIQSFEEVERNSKDEKDEKKDEKKDDKEDAKDEKELQEIKKVEQLLEIKNRDKKIITGLSLGVVGALAFSFLYFNKSDS